MYVRLKYFKLKSLERKSERMSRQGISCDYCYRLCTIPEGERGFCGVRENQDGKLVTLGYGNVLSAVVDPIEKKPLYHFYPGQKTLSVALFGCNLRCDFCQNNELSQPDSMYAPGQKSASGLVTGPVTEPSALVDLMIQKGLNIMTYTYSDPIVWQDYMMDTVRLVKEVGGLNCMITNGSFSDTSLEQVLPMIDAFNIDVKGDDDFYRTYCSGALRPVMRSVERIAGDRDTVLEVTTMIIEGIHTEEHVRYLGKRLYDAGVQVWHLSRFFPYYRMERRSATTESYLQRMLEAASDSNIPYIYAGNSINMKYEATWCPSCGTRLIGSHSYRGEAGLDVSRNIKDGVCGSCGQAVYGLF